LLRLHREDEELTGVRFRASPEAEGRRGDRATTMKRRHSMRAVLGSERREEVWGEVWCGMGCSRCPLIASGEGCRGNEGGVTAGGVVASMAE
jgi:hypothetical protein